jgi:hypothetical protein
MLRAIERDYATPLLSDYMAVYRLLWPFVVHLYRNPRSKVSCQIVVANELVYLIDFRSRQLY